MSRALLLVCLAATHVRADSDDIVSRRVVLPDGGVLAELTVEANLAHNFWAKPLSFAPDFWWSATRRITLGIVHSNASVERFAPGASLCVRTDDVLYCDSAYHGGGLDARVLAYEGHGLGIAPRMRVLVRDVDPFKPALLLGALAKWSRGRYAITVDPYVQLGLANQEEGNRSQVLVPIELAVQPTCRWQLSLSTGWNGAFTGLADGWHVPIAVGARARATEQLDVAVTIGFPTLLGPQNTPKQRVVFVAIGWRPRL